jgi:3-phosphoshikimate 1-carboxyvinyltransferase
VQGDLRCPPDKSITHRSVMFAALAKGESRIQSPLLGADCRSTMAAMSALGVQVDIESGASGEVHVRSPGWDGWTSPVLPLDFGNSGTTTRLLAGLYAATPGLFVTCFGDASLSKRPMGRVVEPLRRSGAKISGRANGTLLPLAIEGTTLKALDHKVDKASAQVKSALVLAGLNTSGTTRVTLPTGSRDHTEKMLKRFGAKITTETDGRTESIAIEGPFRPSAGIFDVPGDPSSAAFLCVLAAIAGGGTLAIRRVLDNPTRTGFLSILERMGAAVSRQPSQDQGHAVEPVMDLVISGGRELLAVDMEPSLAPTLIDEIPILAVAARFARGTSRFRGLEELRVKESDRLAMTISLISAAGGKAWAEGDDLFVEGSQAPVPAFSFDPDADHRLAMAAGVVAKVAEGPCTIKDPSCVAVSFPEFFDVLAQA